MKIEEHSNPKHVSVWLTRAEAFNEHIKSDIIDKIRKSHKGYKIVVFESGTDELAELTKALLKHNYKP